MCILQETHLEKACRKIFHCPRCPQTFLTRHGFQTHVRFGHENEKNFPCKFCPKRFSVPANMRRHVVTRHPENKEAINSCDTCEYKSYSKANLVEHVKRHGPRKHECYFCGKKFVKQRELVEHLGRMHTLEM